MSTVTKEKIYIPQAEYQRLKKLDKQFGELLCYLEDIVDIKMARKEINQKKVISQEKLFKKLGL